MNMKTEQRDELLRTGILTVWGGPNLRISHALQTGKDGVENSTVLAKFAVTPPPEFHMEHHPPVVEIRRQPAVLVVNENDSHVIPNVALMRSWI